MKKLFTATMLTLSCALMAQVGIGTTTPNAELEINTSSSLPALKLNPQTAPVGTATGQLSVIGDILYMYDQTRGKWLSVESSTLNFGEENGSDGQFLEYIGDIRSIGAIMPRNGTIVYIGMNSDGGKSDKDVELYKNNNIIPNNNTPGMESQDGVLTLNGGQFSTTSHNLDFNAGDYLRVRTSNSGGNVEDLTVILWLKWRK